MSEAGGADAHFAGYLVAVGASAGGLDALERLFSALPADSGAAFVVVQHLSPDHKSMMDSLLARYTAMPVRMAAHDMQLTANTLSLIPAGKTMRLVGNRLQLAPKPEHGLSLPIDIFFGSAAEQLHERAIAVVLSGTGSDGSRGVATVNANGGFVFVQDPMTAKFDGMPRSAIATGLVDVVASAEDLAQRIVAHLQAPRASLLRPPEADAMRALATPLETIMDRLLSSSGIDFREYKSTTVLRRIERRMQVLHVSSLAGYAERLDGSLDEQALLRRELLIPVTRFFRDSEAFEQLSATVIPALVEAGRGSSEPLRVWVACCATGEEAYSIAILFAEAFRAAGTVLPVKIFATDVEQQYLDHAAAGSYAHTIAAEVSAERLDRWFTAHIGGYVVRPEIRQMVIFARHNLVADPPFTRMHLVSCRNALIYFQPVAQERALRRLQYALLPAAHLLLGPSESLGAMHRDFAPLPGRGKVYRLVRRDRGSLGVDPSSRRLPGLRRAGLRTPVGLADANAVAVEAGQRQLAQSYAPTTLLVGEARELLHVYGDAQGLLRLAEGQATLDVLKLLPRELGWAAGLLMQASAQQRRPQRSEPLRFDDGGTQRVVQLVARPLEAAENGAPGALTLLSFEPLPETSAGPLSPDLVTQGVEQHHEVAALERELSLTHDTLQATIEELETSNEELQATNEELMASNEELQSTNEELQSVNEELYTVNSEYQEKMDILNSVNADLENVSKATSIPTVFVDEQLVLTRFTPDAALLFKLREGDVGRSLEDFAHTLEYPELFADLRRTLKSGVVTEREVRSRSGDWWLSRIQPYSGNPGYGQRPGRAVMTFVDITSVKDSQRLQAVIDSLAEHLAVVDAQGTITMVNEAWRRFALTQGDEGLSGTGPGVNYLQVCEQGALTDADARSALDGLRAVLGGARDVFTMQYPCHSPDGSRWFQMHVAPVAHPGGGAVVSHIEISDWLGGGRADRLAPGERSSA